MKKIYAQNHGYIAEKNRDTDLYLGSLLLSPLQASGQWTSFLPEKEVQNLSGFDRMACCTYSSLNCLEILMRRKYNNNINFSDRFTAKMSGTDPAWGNTFWKVANSIRHNGLVEESEYPDNADTIEEYYQPIPQNIKNKGLNFLNLYDIHYQFVPTDNLIEALKYGPIQVSIHLNAVNNKGYYYSTTNGGWNHAVALIGYKENEYWTIFDSYSHSIRKIVWNYHFGAALLYSITKKQTMHFVKDPNNSTIWLCRDIDMTRIAIIKDTSYFSLTHDRNWIRIERWTQNELKKYTKTDKLFYAFEA